MPKEYINKADCRSKELLKIAISGPSSRNIDVSNDEEKQFGSMKEYKIQIENMDCWGEMIKKHISEVGGVKLY